MAKQQTKATAVEKLGVLLLDKVDEAVVDEALEALGEPTTGTLKEKCQRIGTWFNDNVDQEANLVDCSVCKGIADITKLDDSPLPYRCPYCGTDAAEPTVIVEKAAKKAAAPKAEERKEPKVIETTGKVVDMESRRTPAAASTKLARVRTPKNDAVSTGSEADLDAKVDEYKQAVVAGVMSYVQISHILRDIDDGKLWKSRLNTEGKKAYDSFEEFAHAELQMSRSHAYRAIAVAKSFTPEEIQKHGFRKLAIIANFKDPIDKAKLLKHLESGTSKRGLEREAGRLRGSEGAEDTEDKVTVALMMKRVRLPMLARGKGEKPAKKLTDEPHVDFELTNGVVLKFRLQTSKSGQIELVMAPTRMAE